MTENKEYEFTPKQSADKLMEFIRDMSDDEDQIEEEKEYVTELFDELQKSENLRYWLIISILCLWIVLSIRKGW